MGDKSAIIELIKNQITAKTTQLTTDNIQKITNDIQSLLKILNDLATIEFVATSSVTQEDETAAFTTGQDRTQAEERPIAVAEVKDDVEPVTSEQVPAASTEATSEKEVSFFSEHWLDQRHAYIGRFHLDLNGGHVGPIKVSESKLHKMANAPTNGDWVKAEEIKDDELLRYKITTLKRDPLPTEIVRLQFLPAVYRQDVKRWCIEFQSPEHETTQQLLLGDYDVLSFKLKPGDYIDYAYRRGQEIDGKIVWKYTASAVVATRMKRQFAKSALEASAETKPSQLAPAKKKVSVAPVRQLRQVFADKSLLLVCIENSAMPRKVKRHVEDRGGKLILSPRSDSNAMLKKKVQKADMVIVTTDFVDHGQMYAAKDEAKRIGKPIWMAKNTNERNMLQWYKRHFGTQTADQDIEQAAE